MVTSSSSSRGGDGGGGRVPPSPSPPAMTAATAAVVVMVMLSVMSGGVTALSGSIETFREFQTITPEERAKVDCIPAPAHLTDVTASSYPRTGRRGRVVLRHSCVFARRLKALTQLWYTCLHVHV